MFNLLKKKELKLRGFATSSKAKIVPFNFKILPSSQLYNIATIVTLKTTTKQRKELSKSNNSIEREEWNRVKG